MPLPIIAEGLTKGISSIPYAVPILKNLPWVILLYVLKTYFGGAVNRSERLLHSKIIMITGGTSGIGAVVAASLAARGAQIILLTHTSPADPFLVEYIEDMRAATDNQMIYAEQVDLGSLHSIRQFATKWVDNAPPRRLDMVVLCANTFRPRLVEAPRTSDGLEACWGVNYLANFHLLGILSPAIRAQPPDRDVRIIIGACSSYIGGELGALKDTKTPLPRGREYGTSKLALMTFAQTYQRSLDAYERPDKQPMNARVILCDPGLSRTPGTRRWISMGSLWGLLLYLVTYPFWWLVLKSPIQGAQTFLRAAMEAELGRGAGGRFLKECREVEILKQEVRNEEVGKTLWAFSEKQIEAVEKESAQRRAREKAEKGREEVRGKVEEVDGDESNSEHIGTDGTDEKAEERPKTASKRSKKA